jgi:hypothetical protein
LFTIKVANASPSISSAIINNDLFCADTSSKIGNNSFTCVNFLSAIKIKASLIKVEALQKEYEVTLQQYQEAVKNYINSHFKLSKPKVVSRGGKIRLDFKVEYPSVDDLKKVSPMPWEGGRSWISSIEKGISGFSNYVYKRFVEGRSGEALQAETKLRSGSYKPVSYMSEIINKFKKGITR